MISEQLYLGMDMYSPFLMNFEVFYFQFLTPYFDPGDSENRIEKIFWRPQVVELLIPNEAIFLIRVKSP